MLETKNLRLVPCDAEILKAAIEGNAAIEKKLDISVPDNWTEFGVEALQYALDRISQNQDESGCWTYFPIYKQENRLIGSGGYKGKPAADGSVEIGYEIAALYRNRGLATEMANALVAHAFKDPYVKSVVAHTLAQENASTKVLQRCGFIKTREIDDPNDGLIWKWELKRS